MEKILNYSNKLGLIIAETDKLLRSLVTLNQSYRSTTIKSAIKLYKFFRDMNEEGGIFSEIVDELKGVFPHSKHRK